MITINSFVDIINSKLTIFVPILVVLISAFITIRYKESSEKRRKFERAYALFKQSFTHAIQQLETHDTTLNALILGGYPKHNIAMKDFVHNLRGLRKKRFLKKWREYEGKYYEIKQLGIFGFAAAIAPSIDELNNCTSPEKIDKWESSRSKELHQLIHDLLSLSKKDHWF